ncbi:MAG: hypothetical protein DBX47_05395 [Clostridiales bacterium]|nr:MAG: hypothetical protein DBX47_05395 [Clostridiales bacterium]
MENNFITSTGLVQTIIGESSAESEIILPDYCPPVMKIVKTEATSMIRTQSVRGDRAFIEGIVDFKICYLPEGDGGMVSMFHQSPFSYSTELKTSEPPQIMARAHTTYYNTRALSPQKMFVKATVEICINVFSANITPCLPENKKCGLEMKNVNAEYSDVLCSEQKTLKISDEIELEKGMDVSKILRYSVSFESNDVKMLSNKVIARGDMVLRIVYSKSNGTFGLYTTKIPLSQIIPTCELGEDAKCLAFFDLSDFKALLKETADNYIIPYDAEISVSVLCYADSETELGVDAFSPTKTIECVQKPVLFHKIVPVREDFDCEQRIEASNAEEIIDYGCSAFATGVFYDSQKQNAVIQGNYDVFAVYKDSNGDIIPVEKSIPFTFEKQVKKAPMAMSFNIAADVSDISCMPVGDGLQMRIKGVYSGMIDMSCEYGAITEINELPEKKAPLSQMVLYYACKGDRVWDIAKKYSASPQLIMKNNGLTSEEIAEDRMLYISR